MLKTFHHVLLGQRATSLLIRQSSLKANFITFEGHSGELEAGVIKPQPMQHADGFTLLAFDSWQDVDSEKLLGAATNILSFKLTETKVGFHND